MDRRRRAARTVALMSLFTMADMQTDVPIASFVGDGSDLVSLSVAIEPIQDLHGYDNPWPAGGGVNKLGLVADIDKTVDGVRFTYDAETGLFSVSGTNTNTSNHMVQVWNATGGARLPDFQIGETYTFFADNNTLPMYMQFTFRNSSEGISALGYCRFSYGKISFTVPNTFVELLDFQMYIDGSATNMSGSSHVWLVEGNVSTSAYTPYSNICPISGWTGADIRVSPTTDAADGTTYSITFPTSAGTVYGGTLDVTTGKLTVDRANIASYNGETLTGRWISDRDVYSAGTTPTIGAQVVYELATPIVYDLTPTQVTTLIGTNNIWADTGDIKYIEYNI